MFVTPKWEISDDCEKLNFALFGNDSSYKKLNKIKKKRNKKNKRIDIKTDKNENNQTAFSSVEKQNSNNLSTGNTVNKKKMSKVKLKNKLKLTKPNILKSTGNTISLSGKETFLSLSNETKSSDLQNTKPILKSGLKRKLSDSSLMVHKSKKKKKNQFLSNNDLKSDEHSSDKEVHNGDKKLSRKEKRKMKMMKKNRENVAKNYVSNKPKSVSQGCAIQENFQADEVIRMKKKKKKKNKHLGKLENTENVVEDNIVNSSPVVSVESDVSKKQRSPYSIQKLKEILETSSNDQQSSKKNTIMAKKKKKSEETLRERMMRKLKASRFRYLNEQLYTSGGKDSKQFFQSDPEAFQAYHEGYQQQVQQWPINPLDVVIKSLQKKSSDLVIADFGCGDARLARSVRNLVHSFDLVAVSKEVTACDMSHTSLSNSSVDVVVFCLSLMGNNLAPYFMEANRVLKEGGLMKIAEVESRFDSVESFISNLSKFGFVNTWKDLSHNLFYFMDFKKERCISKKKRAKLPEITLKPCLYKKR